MNKLFACLVLICTSLIAQATPITYTFSGTGSGSLNSVVFNNAAFNIQIFGNTDDVLDPSVNLDLVANLTSLFTISGAGEGSFTGPLFVFGGAGENFLGFGSDGTGNLIAFFNPTNSLTDYDLRSDFGPIAETNSNLNQFQDASTTAGLLTFNSQSLVTFTSQLNANQVPEPSIPALLVLGLIAMVGTARYAKR